MRSTGSVAINEIGKKPLFAAAGACPCPDEAYRLRSFSGIACEDEKGKVGGRVGLGWVLLARSLDQSDSSPFSTEIHCSHSSLLPFPQS